MTAPVPSRPAATVSGRLACACGTAQTFAGDAETVARLMAGFGERHSGPGHDPDPGPPSQDGRAPRRRP